MSLSRSLVLLLTLVTDAASSFVVESGHRACTAPASPRCSSPLMLVEEVPARWARGSHWARVPRDSDGRTLATVDVSGAASEVSELLDQAEAVPPAEAMSEAAQLVSGLKTSADGKFKAGDVAGARTDYEIASILLSGLPAEYNLQLALELVLAIHAADCVCKAAALVEAFKHAEASIQAFEARPTDKAVAKAAVDDMGAALGELGLTIGHAAKAVSESTAKAVLGATARASSELANFALLSMVGDGVEEETTDYFSALRQRAAKSIL